MLTRLQKGIDAHRLQLRVNRAAAIRRETDRFELGYKRVPTLIQTSVEALKTGDEPRLRELRWDLVTTIEEMRAHIVKAGRIEDRRDHDVGEIRIEECGPLMVAHYDRLMPLVEMARRKFHLVDRAGQRECFVLAAESLDVMCAAARVVGQFAPEMRPPADTTLTMGDP